MKSWQGPKRKIAIVGTGSGWESAPFADQAWEIWSCNAFAFQLSRCDRIFEVHRRWWDNEEDNDYLEKLRNVKPPVMVFSIVPIGGTENTVMDRVALFKKYGATWFSSSFGYMLAQAFEEAPSMIGLWGIDMESREEYVVQQAGVRHFVDLARFVGIEIYIPDDSLLGRDPVPYPDRFETIQALTYEKKAKRLKGLIETTEMGLEEAKAAFYRHDGWMSELSDDAAEKESSNNAMLRRTVRKWADRVAQLKGELWMTQQYKRLFVWNVIPPDIGEETSADVEDCGPV